MAQKLEEKQIVLQLEIIDNSNAKPTDFTKLPQEIRDTPKYKKQGLTGDFTQFQSGDIVSATIDMLGDIKYTIQKCEIVTNAFKSVKSKANDNLKYYTDETHELDGRNVYLPKSTVAVISAFKHMFKNGLVEKCMMILTGKSGFGKTTIAKMLGKELGVKTVRVDMSSIASPTDFIGYDTLNEGSTRFKFNNHITAIQEGNCIVVLDEIDKMPPKFGAILNPILDGSRGFSYRDFDIKIGENVGFVATANNSWDDTASNDISASLLSRFTFQEKVIALPHEQEIALMTDYGIDVNDARKSVLCINTMREANNANELSIEVSTRKTEALAVLFATKKFALRHCFEEIYGKQIDRDNSDEYMKFTTICNTKIGNLTYERLE